MSSVRPAAFAFIFTTVLLDILALGLIIPVLPSLIVNLEGGDTARAATVTGVFGFTWAAMQFLTAPLLGALSDRVGRRPVLLLSSLGLGLDYILMALAPGLGWLFVGRLLSGITSASHTTAAAYIADITPPADRAARFGMLGAAFGLGFIVGPAVGGLLGGIDLRLPFWVAAALSLLNTAYGFFILPESLSRERRAPMRWRVANPIGTLALFRSRPALLFLGGALVLQGLAHEVLPSVFVLYTGHRYAWDEQTVGLALAVVGVTSTIVAAGLVGLTVRRIGEAATLRLGLGCGVIGLSLFGLAPTGRLFCAAILIDALWGLAGPAMQAHLSRHIDPSAQGQLQGAIASLRGMTGMVGPLLFTSVFAWGIQADHIGVPFYLAALLLGGALVLAIRADRR